MIYRFTILALVVATLGLAADDLKSVSAQPNPVKRARMALVYGERVARDAGEACKANDYEKCSALVTEIQESVELASKSLDESGIDSRRNPRHFKDAEIRSHKILKLVEALRAYLHADDLEHYEKVHRRISEINDRFLAAVMGKRKKK